MGGASVELLCMAGDDPPERLPGDAILRVTVDTPDAGPATARITGSGLHEGQRVRIGMVFGIVPHVLIDGVAYEDSDGWRIEDVVHAIRERPLRTDADSLVAQLTSAFAFEAIFGHRVELAVDNSVAAVPNPPNQTLGEWLDQVCEQHSLTVTRRAGASAFQSVFRIGPLAMERCPMPPFTPDSVLSERRFTPAPGVRVAELRVVATTQQRGLIGRVHDLAGFGEDDGVWYAQHICHHLGPTSYEQTLTLVRVGP
jgi:hypothetical protein